MMESRDGDLKKGRRKQAAGIWGVGVEQNGEGTMNGDEDERIRASYRRIREKLIEWDQEKEE
jgi:hypothetical protein